MTDPDRNRPSVWGSRATGPVGWIVSVVCVLMFVIAVYFYTTREDASAPGTSPTAASGSGHSPSARPALPNK